MNYTNNSSENPKNKNLYSSFIDNIWAADLTDVQLISK